MSVPDWLAEMLGDAISDTRAKLVDEAWFGRRVPERGGGSDLGWFQQPDAGDAAVREAAPEPNPTLHELDRGIDR